MRAVKKLVIDTSVFVKWLQTTNEENTHEADSILHEVANGSVYLLAPELAKYEIGNALLNKHLDSPAIFASLGTAYSLPITFVNQTVTAAKETASIAIEGKISFYDAAFLQLARELQAILVTANPKHQKSFQTIRVVALADYRPSK